MSPAQPPHTPHATPTYLLTIPTPLTYFSYRPIPQHMSRHFPTLLVLLALAWILGLFLHLGTTERLITKQTERHLKGTHPLRRSFQNLEIDTSGQEVTLSGRIGSTTLAEQAIASVKTEIRIPDERGAEHNPITAVHNLIKIDPTLAPQAIIRPAWWAWGFAGNEAWLHGQVPDEAARQRIATALTTRYPRINLANNLTIAPGTEMPAPESALTFAPTTDPAQPWAGLAAQGIPARTYGPDLKEATVATDFPALQLDPALLTTGWEPWRARISQPLTTAPSAPTAGSVAPASPASRWGWAIHEKKAWLHGNVPDQASKDAAALAFTTAHPLTTLENTLTITPGSAPITAAWAFPSHPGQPTAYTGLAAVGIPPQTFASDVYDSELMAAYGTTQPADTEVSTWLTPWRTSLAASGTLKLDDPYAALISDGRQITLTGLVAAEPDRALLLKEATTAAAGLPVSDTIRISPLTNAWKDLTTFLGKATPFTPGKSGVLSLRPGAPGWRPVLQTIYFATGQSGRSKDQERALFQIRRALTILPTAKFEVTGHTDNVGNPEANLKLSTERAQSFTKWLTGQSLPTASLSSRGAGATEPVAPNDTAENRALNRRVDITLLP